MYGIRLSYHYLYSIIDKIWFLGAYLDFGLGGLGPGLDLKGLVLFLVGGLEVVRDRRERGELYIIRLPLLDKVGF